MKVDYAILSAMPGELDFIMKEFSILKYTEVKINNFHFNIYNYKNAKVLVAYSGIGITFAASMLTLINSQFNPEYFLVSGTAGGIRDGLKLRDVIIAEQAFEAEVQDLFSIVKDTPFSTCLKHPGNGKYFPSQYSADPELLEICNSLNIQDINIHKGTVVSSDNFPAPTELFDKIKSLDPFCIDMETSAFYQVAWLLNLKILAVRGISNILNSDGSDEKLHESDLTGGSLTAATVLLSILDKSIFLKSNANLIDSTSDYEMKQIIKMYDMKPHEEGGYYVQSFKSKDMVMPSAANRYNNEMRSAGTSIYFLLNKKEYSVWHTLQSDELWHYYKGSAVNVYVIDKNGELTTYLLGDPLKIPGASFQVCIYAGNYFAAENIDKDIYSLVGCTVSPGFEYRDWKLSDKDALINSFSRHKELIERLSVSANESISYTSPK